MIPIYDFQKKAKKFKWTDEAEKAFNEIKKLLVSLPVLKAPTPDDLFRLKSDTSCGWYITAKIRRQMGSYRIPFKKTSQISKEFWHYQVRTNQIIGKHSWVYATIMQWIF